ncbi:serine/threonine protein kinase [Fusarium verticillioides 7600]|uniref:Serine/threonine protein kinase n=1 Tax=Gibberella moniliformis (strain M3125 / FGSC 7600) TaxID=334819 RepID=W7ME91_GIBM7|nr:serine/threonine protein kinase [Fusarium verticillioides 7600]EWG45915.1 serine/threonine protein kinase [Fusarium verticillioides 7600]
MSSLFGFNSDSATSTKILEDLEELNSTLGPIVSAAGTRLPLIPHFDLTYNKPLGKGATFEVNCEVFKPRGGPSPYYVAVKYVVLTADNGDRERRNSCVARELRVGTHPALTNVQEILPLIGYGWNTNLLIRTPFLMVPFSEHGTLSYYLRRRDVREWIDMSGRRDLALDVARGLEALHSCKIIHGDIKPDNVLIFTTFGRSRDRWNQMAKLSDFGGCIFEDESSKNLYGGTPLYNAPEQEGRGNFKASEWRNPKDYYAADIWSLGLTVCEIILGRPFIQKDWLDKGQSKLEFLDQMAMSAGDSLQWKLRGLCSHFLEEATPIRQSILETLRMTLYDDPHKRANIRDVVRVLSQGATQQRPISEFPSILSLPPSQTIPRTPHIVIDLKSLPSRSGKAMVDKIHTAQDENHDGSSSLSEGSCSPKVAGPPGETDLEQVHIRMASQAAAQWRIDAAKVFDHVMNLGMPWTVQESIFKELQHQAPLERAVSENAGGSYFENCLRLALAYKVGFGVHPDRSMMIEYFTISARENEIAMALWYRIASSLQLEIAKTKWIRQTLDWQLKRSEKPEKATRYFMTRVKLYQERSAPLLPTMLDDSGLDGSTLLLFACQDQNFTAAMDICSKVQRFVLIPGEPTPLHWLIKFNETQAESLGNALICGQGAGPGPCAEFVNHCPDFTIVLPAHCLELGGSPLHWAVRTRNVSLVQLLIKLGADVNVCWKQAGTTIADNKDAQETPLEISVQYHLPELVQVLLEAGGRGSSSYSVFYNIGARCMPFARHVIHGPHYRQALRDTIQVLIAQGLDLWIEDERGNSPLSIAVEDPDCETYIVEELLATLPPEGPITSHYALVSSAVNCLTRRHSVSSLGLIASRPRECINALDGSGRNALHYAVVTDSVEAVKILGQIVECDFDTFSSDGDHAIHLAARFGSVGALPLIVAKGVDLNILTKPGDLSNDRPPETPLMIAASRQKRETADFLLENGANPFFDITSAVYPTVLLAACTGPRRGDSILPHLLSKHGNLCDKSVLDAAGSTGWTALHQAAFFGDVQSVLALLDKGADPIRTDIRGKAPLELVTELLNTIRNDNRVIPTHERIFQKGKQAVADLEAALDEVRRILTLAASSL